MSLFVPMASIADSTAVLTNKVLPQHHTAITLLGQMLAGLGSSPVSWLDLACGRGQILAQLEENIPDPALRGRIAYAGYDIQLENSRVAEKIAASLKLGAVEVKTGEMEHFAKLFPPERKFSFVSFTNTVHELRPQLIAGLLLDIILRLDAHGVLYVYDMETLPVPELGAVPWDGTDLKKVLETMFDVLGCAKPGLIVQRWKHATCNGWSVNLDRNNLKVTDATIRERAVVVADQSAKIIAKILAAKLANVSKALEALTRFGAENEEEANQRLKLLYDYWSLERATAQKS